MSLNYQIAMLLVALGLYCLLLKRNIIKLIIGLSIITDGIHLFLISMGYRSNGIAAIVTKEMVEGGAVAREFFDLAVDPLPQALVLTSIVINLCILALALSIAINAYRHQGTLNLYDMRRLKG